MCPNCDEYAVDLEIHGPAQLRRIVKKIQTAIAEGRLRSDHLRSTRELDEQPLLDRLDLSRSIPDVMIYYAVCDSCGRAFRLDCESYHGSGGSWRSVDREMP